MLFDSGLSGESGCGAFGRARTAVARALTAVLVGMVTVGTTDLSAEPAVDFSRDVLPLLSDRCFHCHGPDEGDRQAGLRLDRRDDAVEDRGGYAAVIPGDPGGSDLIERITTDDPDLRMPPADAHRKPLEKHEIAILRRWIADGAVWGRHWAFEPPQKPETDPAGGHPIDQLVRRKLIGEGLELAPAADRATLLRRVSFDLIGMPPTAEEFEAFLDDDSPDAYGRAVDRLLESPHHAERLAMWWLDAARYSDTDGFQQDATRTNWPWRDWVVRAFRDNMPFDRFTILQFAGDLLPDAAPDEILATCFHRNHMTNGEGGRDPEESRIDYVIDRVNTTGTVWLGLTLGCVQCHSHKFDPISHQDYYRLFAFFNSIDEDGRAGGGAKPYLNYRSPLAEPSVDEARRWSELQSARERQARERAMGDFAEWLAERIDEASAGYRGWFDPRIRHVASVEGTDLTPGDDGVITASGPNPRQEDYRVVLHPGDRRVTAIRLDVLADPSRGDGTYSRGDTGNFILTNVKLQLRRRGESQVREIDLRSALANVEQSAKGRNYGNVKDTLDDDPRNGWTLPEETDGTSPSALFVPDRPLTLGEDEELIFWMMHRSTDGDANIARFRIRLTDQAGPAVRSLGPMPIARLADTDPRQLPETLREALVEQYLEDRDDFQAVRRDAEAARHHLGEMERAAGDLNVMVLSRRDETRPSHVLVRGVWDRPGEAVSPGFPPAILRGEGDEPQGDGDEAADTALTRLDLARWLVDPDNPLTARVVANHLWRIAWGDGLVRTPEDFGLQGEPPAHPELLDWLAVELVESGWDVRHLLRQIVTSDVYRQRSEISPEALDRDPENRWLARGARYRLPSWMIRDAALRVSGLLNPQIGGPPVYPYQPPGVWEEIFMGRFTYRPSPGPAQYRRTLYAFWRRSSAPTFLFDSAQRRVCEVQTSRTNTPLQALTLLNDEGLLEASCALARQAAATADSPAAGVAEIFRRVLFRSPEEAETAALVRVMASAEKHYRDHPQDAAALLAAGQGQRTSGRDEGLSDRDPGVADDAGVAALAVVAGTILNLDEAITHE